MSNLIFEMGDGKIVTSGKAHNMSSKFGKILNDAAVQDGAINIMRQIIFYID